MTYKIIVDPTATLDIIEAIEWYNQAKAGLGIKFYKQVQAVFRIIQNNPSSFAIRYKNCHTAIVRKFPFMVHYFIDNENNTVVIVSVLHTSRDPKMWDKRNKK